MSVRWPDVDHPRTPVGWQWPPNLLVAQGPAAWPRGRRPASEAEEILAEAVAWWDVDRSGFRDGDRWLRNLGTGGGVLDLRLGSSLLANSNDPKWLGPEASGYVYLPGVNSNSLSVPDAANLRITGDLDVRAFVALDSWKPSGITAFIAKASLGGANEAWYFSVAATTGVLRLSWTANGSSYINVASTVAPSVADGAALWVRATLDVDNGAGQYEVKFYTSSDAVSWSQLGSTVTGSTGPTSVFAGTLALTVGSGTTTGYPLSGRVFRAQVLDGIDGTMVLDVDCDALTSGSATSFTATTGQQVSINRATSGRKSVAMPARSKGGRPLMLHGSDDYMEVVDAQQHGLLNFSNADSFTIAVTGRQWATPPSGRPFISKSNFSTNSGWRLANNSTSLQARIFGSVGNMDASSPTFTAGTNVLMMGVTNRVTRRAAAWANGTSGTPSVLDPTLTDLRVPSLTRIGSNSDGSVFYQDFEFRAAAIWRRPLTSREITVLANSGIWGT